MNQQKLIFRKREIAADLAACRKTIREIVANGFSSASLSGSGGSKTYTRLDLDRLYERERKLVDDLAAILRALRGAPSWRRERITEVRWAQL